MMLGSVKLQAYNPRYVIHGKRVIDVDQSERAVNDVGYNRKSRFNAMQRGPASAVSASFCAVL
jgi:hypothetical protein